MFSARSTEALSITGRSQPTAIVTPDKRINDGHTSLPRHCDGHKSLPRNMHPMRSFSVPTPPPLGPKSPGGPTPKHQIGMYHPVDLIPIDNISNFYEIIYFFNYIYQQTKWGFYNLQILPKFTKLINLIYLKSLTFTLLLICRGENILQIT
jgi:hypothetical protein